MMKMYKQPNTDIVDLQGERMMQDVVTSINPSGGGGDAHAPGYRGFYE